MVTVAEPSQGTVTRELLPFAVTLNVPVPAVPIAQARVIFTPPDAAAASASAGLITIAATMTEISPIRTYVVIAIRSPNPAKLTRATSHDRRWRLPGALRRAVMDSVVGPPLYLLFVVVLPVASTWGAVALLAGAFRRASQPHLRRVLGAIGPLLVVGLLVFATATGSGYAAVAALEELIVASAAGLVGAVVLILKPPTARRVAAVLLVTVYPLVLFGLGWAGSLLSSGATRWLVVN